MRQKLDMLTNIVVIAVALVVGGIYVRDRYHPPTHAIRAEQRVLRKGDLLASLPGYDWQASERTLILALRNGCHYCEDSVPFYKKLEEMTRDGKIKNIHVVAIFPDDQIVAQEMMKRDGLNLEIIPTVNFQILGISGTPTAILADKSGRVVDSWIGELKQDQQQVMLGVLGLPPTT